MLNLSSPPTPFPPLQLPSQWAPWVSVAIVQLLLPASSFLGHVAGVAAGYVVFAAYPYISPFAVAAIGLVCVKRLCLGSIPCFPSPPLLPFSRPRALLSLSRFPRSWLALTMHSAARTSALGQRLSYSLCGGCLHSLRSGRPSRPLSSGFAPVSAAGGHEGESEGEDDVVLRFEGSVMGPLPAAAAAAGAGAGAVGSGREARSAG